MLRIELLTSPGCPNVAVVKQTLAECLDALGFDVPVAGDARSLGAFDECAEVNP